MTVKVATSRTGLIEPANLIGPIVFSGAAVLTESEDHPEHLNKLNCVSGAGWTLTGDQSAARFGPSTGAAGFYSISTATTPAPVQPTWGLGTVYGFYPVAPAPQYNLAGGSVLGHTLASFASGAFMDTETQCMYFGRASNDPAATGFASPAMYVENTSTVLVSSGPFEYSYASVSPAITGALALAELVEFEDGMENEFTMWVINLVMEYGAVGVDELATALFRPGVRPEIVAQTLLCFARVNDDTSVATRSRFLRRGLLSASAKVRDAATVGIASISDVGAKTDLAAAIKRESVPSLKKDMQDVLSQL